MSFMFKPFRFTDPEAVNTPFIPQEIAAQAISGNEAVAQKLIDAAGKSHILFLDGYVGALFSTLCARIADIVPDCVFFDLREAWKGSDELEEMLAESLPQDRVIDPILLFGKSIDRTIDSLFDSDRSAQLKSRIEAERGKGKLVVVFGCGATYFKQANDVAAYLDVTPLETTLRIRERKVKNLVLN